MYEYIKGNISGYGKDYLVLECNNVGYKIFTSNTTMGVFSDSMDEVKIYTHLVVREDDIFLCGFAEFDELEIFRLLTSVSGVGVKVGLAILSAFDYKYLVSIIAEGDSDALTQAPGIGKKTAQRMILELKDKVSKIYGERFISEKEIVAIARENSDGVKDAISALVSLGYSKNEATKAIREFDGDNNNVESIIKFALLKLSRY